MSWEEQVEGFNMGTQTRSFFHLDKYFRQAALVMEQEGVGVPKVSLEPPRKLKTVKPCLYCC